MGLILLGTASVLAGGLVARNLPERAPTLIALAEPEADEPPIIEPLDPVVGGLEPASAALLLDRTAPEAGFVAAPLTPAPMVCTLLVMAGLPMGAWSPDAFAAGESTCLSEVASVDEAGALRRTETGGATTIFAMVRSRLDGRLETVRFKINGVDEATSAVARGMVAESVGRVFDALGWPLPAAATRQIEDGTPFTTEIGGWRLELFQEFSDARRLNIILNMPGPSAVRAAGTLVPRDPTEVVAAGEAP